MRGDVLGEVVQMLGAKRGAAQCPRLSFMPKPVTLCSLLMKHSLGREQKVRVWSDALALSACFVGGRCV